MSEDQKLLQNLQKHYGTHGLEIFEARAHGKEETEKRRRWTSLVIVYMGQFVMFMQGSIYWVSLWPFLSQVDPTVPESFQGFVIAIYNVGTMLASPVFGYWSNRIKQTKLPILCGILINIFGCLLLAFVEGFPVSSRRWVFLAARFIAGFGAGNQAVLQAYVAMASTLEERDRAFSFNAATTSLAVLLGPGIQAMLQPIGYPGYHTKSFFFNMYTAPAYLCIVCDIIVGVLIMFAFKEYIVSVHEPEDTKAPIANKNSSLLPYDILPAVNCIVIRFIMLFCVVYDDTVGSPFTMAMFKWNRSSAVLYNGIISAVSGLLDFCGNLLVGNVLLKYVRERILIVLGLISFGLFYVFSFSWPGLPLEPKDPTPNVSLTERFDLADGCFYSWCSYTTRIHLWQYLVGFTFLAFAFSLAFTSNSTLYSKVLGPRRQGFMQGVFVSSGNFGMVISPILVSYLFEYVGPRVAWIVAFSLCMLTVLLVLASYKRMISYYEKYYYVLDEAGTSIVEQYDHKVDNIRRYSIRDTGQYSVVDD